MVSKRADPAHRKRSERWKEIVRAYRNRHCMWTMEHLPTMTEGEWKQYLKWVADFGGNQQRKLKRRLSQARGPTVTATVTNHGEVGAAIQNVMQGVAKGVRTTRLVISLGQDKAVAHIYKNAPRRNSLTIMPLSAGATRRR